MNDTGWFLLVALSALALASMAVRGVTRYRGVELGVYVVTMTLAAGAGCGVAAAWDAEYLVLGGVCGLACVEVGPAVARVTVATVKRLAGKLGTKSDD